MAATSTIDFLERLELLGDPLEFLPRRGILAFDLIELLEQGQQNGGFGLVCASGDLSQRFEQLAGPVRIPERRIRICVDHSEPEANSVQDARLQIGSAGDQGIVELGGPAPVPRVEPGVSLDQFLGLGRRQGRRRRDTFLATTGSNDEDEDEQRSQQRTSDHYDDSIAFHGNLAMRSEARRSGGRSTRTDAGDSKWLIQRCGNKDNQREQRFNSRASGKRKALCPEC